MWEGSTSSCPAGCEIYSGRRVDEDRMCHTLEEVAVACYRPGLTLSGNGEQGCFVHDRGPAVYTGSTNVMTPEDPDLLRSIGWRPCSGAVPVDLCP